MSADPSDPTRILEDEFQPDEASPRIEDTPTKVLRDTPRIEDTPTRILPDTAVHVEDAEAATVLTDVGSAEAIGAKPLPVEEDADQTLVSEAQPAAQRTRVVEALQEEAPTQAELAVGLGTAVQSEPVRRTPAALTDAMPASAAAPVAKTRGNLTGTRLLNRYRVGDQLGVGGFGTVYRAVDELKMAGGEDAEIAIKVMDAELVQGRLDVLVQEVSRSHHVSHPNILRVYDIHRDHDLAFITMEMLEGVELADMIQGRSFAQGTSANQTLLAVEEVDRIAQGVCRALAHCHQHKMVHADIKPANIFVCTDGTVKVLDLGIAQIMGSRGSISGYSALYASPEQIAGEASDPRDDVFSVACSLYLCLTGEHPFDAASSKEAQAAGQKVDVSKLPRRYRRALASALAFRRDERTASTALLWKQVSPAVRRRNAIFAGLGVIATAGIAAASLIGQSIGEDRIAVSSANQALADTAYARAIEEQSSGVSSGREGLLEAVQANPYHDEAATGLADLLDEIAFTNPAEYSLLWADFGFALEAAPTSEALQEAARTRIDGLLSADPSALPRSRVLSEYRAPLCVLPQAGYRSEEIEALRLALDLGC